MKKKYIYALALAISASVYTSCQRELLAPAPQTFVAAETSFATPARISNQLLSLYASLKTGAFYGPVFLCCYVVVAFILKQYCPADLLRLVAGYDPVPPVFSFRKKAW